MEFNNVIIHGQDNYGRGLTRINDKVVFVKGALDGDICDIKIINDKKKYSEAIVTNYIKTSRVKAECKYYEVCGGCNLMHQEYDKQLQFMEDKVRNLVKRNFSERVKVNKIVFKDQFNYRNKIVLHVRDNKVGLYKEKSNDIVEIDKCMLVDNRINKIIRFMNEYSSNNKINDNEVLIRVGSDVMVSFKEEVDKKLIDYIEADTIIVADKVIKGNGYIISSINDLKFKVSDKSFFQVNHEVVSLLYNEVINVFKNKHFNSVLDLYSGTGTITLSLASYVDKIVGIEIVEEAVKDANFNKDLNSIKNAQFICGKVEDNIDKFSDIDVIVVDPPRSGLDKKTINNILRIKPETLCYVSCDIQTLFRDLKILSDDYIIEEITPVAMFPNTHHVESVCVIKRR